MRFRLLPALVALLALPLAAAEHADDDLPVGGSIEHVFAVAGAFAYYCIPHPGMVGVVQVVDGSPAENVTVDAIDLRFTPQDVTVGPGSRVTWRNPDVAFHTVTAKPAGNPSPAPPLFAGLAILAAGALLLRRRPSP